MPSSGGQTCALDRKSTRLNSSHGSISYAVFSLKKKTARSRSPLYIQRVAVVRALSAQAAVRHSTPPPAAWPAYRRSSTASIIRFFFFNDTATTEIYTLSLHDALPI